MSDTKTTNQVTPDITTQDRVIEDLDVLKAAPEIVTEEEPTQTKKFDDQDDGESASSSDNEEASKELGLVISALQSTVKQNKEDRETAVEDKGEVHECEEELHSGDDIESDTKSVTDDTKSVTSVATSASTNVSLEEGKEIEEVATAIDEVDAKPQTFEEIVHDILPPTPGVAPQRQTFDFGGRQSEDVGDVESYSANLIALNKIDTKEIKANLLSPRQQERAGKYRMYSCLILITYQFFFFKR